MQTRFHRYRTLRSFSREMARAGTVVVVAAVSVLSSCTPSTTVTALAPVVAASSQAAPQAVPRAVPQAVPTSLATSLDASVEPMLVQAVSVQAPAPSQPAVAVEEGLASWYGPGFAGRLTASGEVFDPNELTAAHKTLPFGTRVRVTSVRNGRSVVVRINDRGPFKPGRIIDLSRAAGEAIGLMSAGITRVTVAPVAGTSRAGAVRAGPRAGLNPYEVISASHPVGTLLVLSGVERSDRVVVRVAANGPAANGAIALQVSEELFAVIGSAVVIETE